MFIRWPQPRKSWIGGGLSGALLLAGIALIRASAGSNGLVAGVPAQTAADAGIWITLFSAALLALILSQMLIRRIRPGAWRGRGQSGTAMIEMLIIIVPLYMMFAIMLQVSMIAYCSLVVRHAAFAAARAGIVDSDRDSADPLATQAACLALATICEYSNSSDQSGTNAGAILRRQGSPWADPQFAGKVAFARAATTVKTNPQPVTSGPTKVTVNIRYRFRLGIPGGQLIFPSQPATIAGVAGYYMDLNGTCELTSTGSLEGDLWNRAVLP